METVKHLWNINQFMAKLKNPLTKELQMCYTKKCQNLSRIVELPKQNFGPSVACSHCGSLWSIVDHQVRILHGKKMSKSIRKIVKSMDENNENIPKVRASLARKAIKNKMNKLVIKCSQCSNKTEVPFEKKPRLKPSKLNDSEINIEQNKSKRKKKRKSRNKYAGLNMSFCTPELKKNDKTSTEVTTPKVAVTTPKIAVTTPKIAVTTPKVAVTTPKVAVTTPKVAVTTPKIAKNTPKRNKMSSNITTKSKKLNVQRLKQIVQQQNMKSKTKNNSLHNFLTQLSK